MPFFRTIEDILWPRCLKCLCCNELSEGKFLCKDCQLELQGERLPEHYAEDGLIRSTFRYDGKAKQLVLTLKMACVADAADVLAQHMVENTKALALPPDTVLTWVTMPKRRLSQRGIDHGRLLCQAVAKHLNLPAHQLLVRTKQLHTQRGLDREARLRNLAGTIACVKPVNAPVLLIDDVLTTGATISACADALRQAGAPAVYALTATKVMFHRKD